LHNKKPLSRSEISALLHKAKIRPSKKLGQNFLVDDDVLSTIIDEVTASDPCVVVEIGAGLGMVTHELAKIANRVIALELDYRLAEILEQTVGKEENVEICRQDFLSFSFTAKSPDEKALVVGNIPYRITAPILKHLISERNHITETLLLTQQEVAAKIANSPGKDGTSLGVLVQAYADVKMLRRVPSSSFFPAPKVDSMLWKLSFLGKPRFQANPDDFFAIVQRVYGLRRKMIRVTLRNLFPNIDVEEMLNSEGIDPTLRGEALSFAQLDTIAQCLGKHNLGTITH
jgi:16S rRNA (adenine1518-N6/adenine1519-N6)-dimethyltransferase